MNYNPNVSPNFALWLELDEAERITTVIAYHERNREKLPNQRLHATIHVIIENQLAEQIPAVTDALTRLIADGLDRHEAVHAIGSVLAKYIFNMSKGQLKSTDPTDAYLKDLSVLTVQSWRDEAR